MRLHDDDGQVLLFALGFLIFFGLVIGALATFAEASVLSSERLREQRSTVYVADGAIDVAIRAARADKTIGAFGASPCMHASAYTVTATTTDAMVASVDCVSVADPIDLDRTVKFSASVAGVPIVVATVVYHDSTAGTGPSTLFISNWTYCVHDSGACP